MTRELLSSWVTLPVYRDTTLLNHLERGGGGGEEKEGGGGEREREGGGRGRRGGRGEGRGRREDMEKKSDSVQNVAGVIKV